MEAIQPGERVYLTHINTPRQVVIGGEDAACRRVAESLKCMNLKAPYDHAIHCPPVESEFDDFVRLHDWPVENDPDIPVYSAANYEPLRLESREIAQSFARMLTHPIDFPRLVNRAYDDGARIFIELGAGSNCSKWVDAILKDKRHASATINQVNVEDHVSILKLLARLISHRVSVDLSALVG
jgi:PfaB family protein